MLKLKVVGIKFDHIHMGDLLRHVNVHKYAKIVGIFDPAPKKLEGPSRTFPVPVKNLHRF